MVCGLHIFQRFIWKPIQYQLHIIVKREARLDQIYKTDLNELFSYQRKGEKLEEKEKVIEIEIERLRDFKEHPFHVKDDKEMSLLKESIKNYGILSPLIVRPVLDGVYEIVSGHRRKYAAQQLGYHNIKKEIVIRKEMSESQTLKTVIHESAHAKLHDKEHMEKTGEKKDQLTREVEAESVAYCVCNALGLDTSDYSFPYIAGWSSGTLPTDQTVLPNMRLRILPEYSVLRH